VLEPPAGEQCRGLIEDLLVDLLPESVHRPTVSRRPTGSVGEPTDPVGVSAHIRATGRASLDEFLGTDCHDSMTPLR
jgi:hypothetical protein